jgi:drug/metabolite transporter (DMT)-like permease
MMIAIAICVVGVIVLSVDPKRGVGSPREAMLGIASGAFFGMSAIGFRGAILSLHSPNYVMAATFTLTLGLLMQSVLLTIWLAIRSPQVLRALMRLWRPSLLAGFMGAGASEMWFLAFALTSAANVRTLGLVDVAFAQAVSRFVFNHRTTPREYAGIALLLLGAILLVIVHR